MKCQNRCCLVSIQKHTKQKFISRALLYDLRNDVIDDVIISNALLGAIKYWSKRKSMCLINLK